jgi:stage III sporulation protein AF
VKKVGQLAGGLIILLAIAVPPVKVDFSEFSWIMTEYRMQNSGSDNLLNLENTNMVKKIIEEQTAAYISDKATELGMDCTVEVTYQYSDDGMAYPESVRIKGAWDHTQQQALSDFIESNLAVSKDNQTYEREQDP